MIRASDSLINYIKKKESFRAEPYKDSTGKWTVGYGDTEGEMTTVSETEAHRRLVDRLNITAHNLNKHITRKNFTQNQADVLFDMEYNIGITKLKDQGFIDLVNNGTDEQIGRSILNFNKARNRDTGELEIEKGLEVRAGERATMWGYKGHLQPIGKLPSESQDIYSNFRPKEMVDDIYANFKPAEVKPIDLTASRKVDLSLTGEAFDPADAQKLKEVKKFSNEEKVPFNEAEALIFDRNYKDVKLERMQGDIAKWFSTTAEWAKQMDHYAILKESPEAVTRIESSARGLSKDFLGALGTEIKNNKYQLEDSYVLANALFGNMNPKQAAKALEESERASNNIGIDAFREGKDQISKKWMKLSKALGKTTDRLGRAVEAITSDNGSIVNELRGAFDGSTESSYRLWDAFKAMAEDPKATALLTAQNLSSFAVSAGGAAAGGVAGFLTPVPGGASSGATYGAGVATGLYSFGLHAKELIQEKYTDPVTGKVLYDVALSDPKFVSELRLRSALYAGVMGLVDAKFTGMAGGKTVDAVKRIRELPAKNSFVKKSLLASKEFGKGVLTQTLGEGISETVASGVSAAAGGELTAQKAGELVGKGVEEAALSLGTGIGIEGAGTAARLFKRSPRESIVKTAEVLKNSESATASYNTLQTLRSNLEDPNVQNNDLEIEDLINRVVIPQEKDTSVSNTVNEEQLNNAIDAEDKNLSELDDQGYVSIYPSDWDSFHKETGVDANEALVKLGDDVINQYVGAKESDTSIKIPIGKWITATKENPEIDAIAYVNENKMNAVQATEAFDGLEKDPFMFFDVTAYHGSPYDFKQFSTKEIGKGEGAQAFGYGLYFTEDKDIAEYYRKNLTEQKSYQKVSFPLIKNIFSKVKNTVETDTEFKNTLASQLYSMWQDQGYDGTKEEVLQDITPAQMIFELIAPLADRLASFEQMITELRKQNFNIGYDKDLVLPKYLIDAIESAFEESKFPPVIGQTYEVNLKTEKEKMLDWRAMYKDQSDYVKEKLAQYNIAPSTTGDELYRSFSNVPRFASERLMQLGIPGIKYEAQQGRSDKYNFVVFSDQNVEIARTFYEETPPEDTQPIPDVMTPDQFNEFEPVSADQIDKMEMRPVGLYNRFRDEDSKRAFKKILGELKASTKGVARIEPASLETLAEIQFRHTQSRAQMLGMSVGALADRLSFGKSKRAEAPDKNGRVTGGGFIHPQAVTLFRKIFFTKYATTKTLVHELGHSWIHEMTEDWYFISNIPDASLTAQQREYKKGMEIAAELFGLNTIDDFYKQPTEKISAMHEKFAQTTERYFFEGKFENSRIRQLLETFRQWMAKVAKLIGTSYPEYGMFEITPEVERMFDAILDANTKIEQELFPMFPEPMFPDEFLGSDAGKYLDLLSDVKSEATGKLYANMMKAPLKEREAMINKALEEFNKQAADTVDRLPSMKMLKTFKDYYAQYKKGQLESSPRISYESFKKILASDDDVIALQLKEKIPMEMVEGKKKGGVNIETVMQQLGITDPKEMLNRMLEANLRDELINDTVNEIIDKKLPLFKSDAEIHAEAVKAMNSKGKEKIILEEFKILSDKFKPQLRALIAKGVLPSSLLGTKDVKNTIDNKGLDLVLDAPIKGFNYNRFLKDSSKHGRNAAANFKRGNILEAFDEKYKEAIHFSAYRSAIEVSKKLAETKVLIKNFSKLANDQTKANEYDTDLMRYGDVILNLYRNGVTALPKLSLEGFADESGISPEHVDLINQKIDKLGVLSKGRGGRDASILSYATFGSILSTIKKFARDAKRVEIGGQEVLRADAIKNLVAQIGPRQINDVGFTEIEAVQSMLLTLRPVRSELASLFPDDVTFEKSVLGQIYADVTKAEALRNEKLDVARMKVIDAVRNAVKTEDKAVKELIRPITNLVGSFILNTPPKPIRLQNLNVTLENKSELYMLMLEIGSDSGLEKVLRGGVKGSGPLANYNMDTGSIDTTALQKDIDALIEAKELTKKDFDMFQVVWDQFEEFYPDLQKSIRRTDGRQIGYIKGRSITTPWGTYKGGYVPISSESYATQEALKSLRSPDNTLFKSNELYPYMDLTTTQQRSGKFYDVSLDFSRITAKLAGVANIAYLREPLLNAGKVLGSTEVNAAIENRRPGFYDASLIPWFNRTKLQQFSEPSTEFVHKFSKILRSNMNLKFYFGNVTSALKQFLGVSNAIPLVGAKNLTIASGKVASSPMATLKFIASKDLRMKQMFENHHINQIKSFERLDLNFDWLSEAKDKYITPFAFFLIKEAQNRTSAVVWLAGYQKALSEGLNEKQAINFAINAVKNSQGSTTISDMAQVQFGKDAWKLFTAFSIVPITGGAEIYKAYMRTGTGEKGIANSASRVGGALTVASFTVAVPAVINAIIADSLKSKEEEEEERISKRKTPEQMRKEKNELLTKQMTMDFIDQLIPVYGKMAARPLLYGDVSVSPIIDSLAQDIKTATIGKKVSEAGAEINAREFAAVMNLLTYGTGLPFTIIGKAEKMSEKSMPKSEKVARAKKRKATLKRAKQLERNE